MRGGAIGRLKEIRTSFCFRTTRIADNVRFRPDLAGWALIDVGCYCLSFARLFAGREPGEVYATGHLHETGVDDLASGVLRFGNCPFHRLAADYTELMCGMNLDLVAGLLEVVGPGVLSAALDPGPDRCCVTIAEK